MIDPKVEPKKPEDFTHLSLKNDDVSLILEVLRQNYDSTGEMRLSIQKVIDDIRKQIVETKKQ